MTKRGSFNFFKLMKAGIQIFENPQFGNVRVAMSESNEPLFCAKDVATALGYSDTNDAVARHCKSGKKVFHPHTNGFGGVNLIYIPEKDVYRLIMRSNLPDAEKFQDWVCDEVLPSIRKTDDEIETDYMQTVNMGTDEEIEEWESDNNGCVVIDDIGRRMELRKLEWHRRVEGTNEFIPTKIYFLNVAVCDDACESEVLLTFSSIRDIRKLRDYLNNYLENNFKKK